MSAAEGQVDPVRVVLGAVASLSRLLSSEQRRPFEGRILTGSQLSALFFLARNPSGSTPGRLAELLAVSAGAVTQLVDTLRAEGHVDIGVHPDDARSRIIVLSRTAHDEVEHFEGATAERLRPRFAALTPAELTTLANLMNRVTVETKE
ncbi:MarR family winged helix-turn-helix transcriptional regulator [Cryobacterium sp. PH31-O1]|uniref:MarR family winged helix-turn-helix transcriptional regulator n=1 Tax=Cryobacterium sp. PH31-O1 TaxID=3046306 RepID=UPI0024BBDEB9|nr:MarR family winged helix-turn-helix transcriptional regulator [Cryobacterium sp. PH31-O1]MDJ0337902.1 MarR family winged helix-turn-helix transcriptional regulator [Cryobacterium sp. PH31-O1]